MNHSQRQDSILGLLPPSMSINPNKHTLVENLVGSKIACQGSVEALLRLASCSDISIFVPPVGLEQTRRELAHIHRIIETHHPRATASPVTELANSFIDHNYTAFHDVTGTSFHLLAYIRSQFSQQIFPVTSGMYAFSYQTSLFEDFARLALTPSLPCDSIICTSVAAMKAYRNCLEQVCEELRHLGMPEIPGKPRLDVIPLGIDTDLYRPRDRADTRRLLGLPPHKTILLFFGRVDPATKADLAPLLHAFAELLKKHQDDVVLVLAGGASLQTMRYLEELAHRLGCHEGIIARSQVPLMEGPLYFSASDVFVSPTDTLQESFGLTPVEAMSSGIPVVVSDWSAYRETVEHERTGFTVTTRWLPCETELTRISPLTTWESDHLRLGQSVEVDVAELITYLDALITNRQLREDMGNVARSHVVRNFNWPVVIAKYEALWDELNQVGKHETSVPTPIGGLLVPQYFRNFGHYASVRLNGSERVRLTDSGQEICLSRRELMPYSEMNSILDKLALAGTLATVRGKSLFRSVTIQDLCDQASARYLFSDDISRAHVIWLLKQGYLQLLGDVE